MYKHLRSEGINKGDTNKGGGIEGGGGGGGGGKVRMNEGKDKNVLHVFF